MSDDLGFINPYDLLQKIQRLQSENLALKKRVEAADKVMKFVSKLYKDNQPDDIEMKLFAAVSAYRSTEAQPTKDDMTTPNQSASSKIYEK